MGKRFLKSGYYYTVVEVKRETDSELLHRKVLVDIEGVYDSDSRGFVKPILFLASGKRVALHAGVRLHIVPSRKKCYCPNLNFPHRPGTAGCVYEEIT